MSTTADRALIWAPRIITLAFALLIAAFAADVFGEGRPFGWVMIALIMHLIPSIVVAAIAVVAWKYEWFGATAAGFLALLYFLTKGSALPWYDTVFIAGPLAVIALLYGVNAFRHRVPTHA